MRLEHGVFPDAATDALTPGSVRDWTGDETYGSSRVPDGFKRSWNAPTCERCWVTIRGFIQPARVAAPDERGARACAFCGRPTWAGIFTRTNPSDVPYPSLEPVE